MKLRLGALSVSALAIVFAGCTTPEKPPPPVSPPVITSFTVDKTQITQGESVAFTLAAERGKSASLKDQTGAEIAVTFDAAAGTGTATATPTASSFYILRVEGDGGTDTAFVQVAVDEGLKSVFLVVVPQVVKAGESVDVLWSAVGGQNISVTAGQRSLSADPSGQLLDTPTTSTTYTLSAQKLDGSMLTTTVDVQVMPVIDDFSATPPVARPGETITLAWKTAGGERVVVSEATFGELVNDTTNVDTGSHDFVVPYYQGDAGVLDPDAGTPTVPPVRDGFPLRFTLTLSTATPAQSVSRAVDGRVGQGPVIDAFHVPTYATTDRPQTVSWQTTNAYRVELYADGLLVAAPRAGQALDASFSVPPIVAATEFKLVAYDYNGLSVSATGTVTPVPPPAITSFTTPAQVASAGAAIAAQWQTSNATKVVIKVQNGPNLFFSDVANEVGMGMRDLRVAATTTFVLEAYNQAGDKATASSTTTVTTPAGITFTPEPSAENTPIAAQWDVSGLGAIDLLGLPNTAPQVTMASTNFVDLDTVPAATKLVFSSNDNGAAEFTAPAGFVFPFVTSRVSTFGVSTNGALLLSRGAAGNTNADLGAAAYAGPAMLAPFWDDLDLGANGSVKYYLDGVQFPRRLIVQWSKLEKAGTAGTELTFQVQLFETGKFLFVYKTLTAVDTDSATIGAVESKNTFQHAVSFNAAGALAEGQETSWFAGDLSRVLGTQALTLSGPRPFGFFVENASSQLIALQGTPRVFGLNSVVVNEVMPVANGSVPSGQWVELYNTTGQTLDLSGLQLVSNSGAAMPYALQDVSIDAGAYLVLGQSTDPVQNGEANVSVAWGAGELPMIDADTVSLQIPSGSPFTVSSLTWTGGPADGGINSAPGESVQPRERAIVTSSTLLTCARMTTFGANMQVGTPGAPNETCFPYRLEPIPGNYEDISGVGTAIFPAGTVSNVYTADGVDLPRPFRYFGQDYSKVWLSWNGWIAFTSQTSANSSNPTTTSTTRNPQGAIAPFWDTLRAQTGSTDTNVFMARVGNATIIQWHHFQYNLSSITEDLNFQAKLFDNGVIEFHYGALTPGNTSNYALGSAATAWIERPGMAAALPIIRNSSSGTTLLAPYSAWRFTPVN